MRKKIITMLALGIFCVSNLAFAAQTPNDVPVDHWAYPAVNALVKAGIIDGYPDGTFKGDKPISRYEMSQIVKKALSNEDKATREQKALIDKLAIEFALEINKIDTRVKELEKNQSALKIDGFARFRYEYVKNPRTIAEDVGLAAPSMAGHATDKASSRTLMWLNISNKFDGDTYFHGILTNETLGGRTAFTGVEAWEANFNKKIGKDVELGLGRFFPNTGYGTIGGAPYMDGAKLAFGSNIKVYAVKFGDRYYPGYTVPAGNPNFSSPNGVFANRSFILGDAKFDISKDVSMSLAFNADKHKEVYNSVAVGMTFKGMGDFVLDGEYAKNSANIAKTMNSENPANPGPAPKAYFVRLKYKGANPFVVGSYGLKAQYKHADAGFDPMSFADPFAWNAPFNYSTPSHGGSAENVKGFEYSFESTIANRTIFSVSYDKLKRVKNSPMSLATNDNQDFFTAQVMYLF